MQQTMSEYYFCMMCVHRTYRYKENIQSFPCSSVVEITGVSMDIPNCVAIESNFRPVAIYARISKFVLMGWLRSAQQPQLLS